MNHVPTNVTEFTVSELSFALKRTVEETYEHVRVRGEVSGFKGAAGSGHCYFRLKDERACLEAVIWKTTLARLRFKPQEGLEMVATGKLTTYPGRSNYQIVVDNLEPAGAGALMALLEERRLKLAAEGLFAAERKKPIPYLPRVIGVITSPAGAVIRDILHRLRDRFPSHVLVWPVRVQGEGAAHEVAAAVRGFNAIVAGGRVPRPDLLIVARGGGSIEDLWAFNEEVAVRAVAESLIPTIAAVGHETDWTLIDHAADLRAPTPTGAAEKAVPVRAELAAAVRELASRHELGVRRFLETERRHYVTLCRALPSLGDLISLPRQRLDDIGGRLSRALAGNLATPKQRLGDVGGRLGRSLGGEIGKKRRDYLVASARFTPQILVSAHLHRRQRLNSALQSLASRHGANLVQVRRDLGRTAARLDIACVGRIVGRHRDRYGQVCRLFQTLRETASPEAILAKGYALVFDGAGRTVRAPADVAPGDALRIRTAGGGIAATVAGPEIAALPAGGRAVSRRGSLPRPSQPPPKPRQESLF
jgi:exodeoxyribonuclease VII large subunit